MENSSKQCTLRKNCFFSTNVVFSADMAENFGNFCCQGRKRTPQNFTFWALNRPFLGKKHAFFFPEWFLTHFIAKKIFEVEGPFLTFLDGFSTKKYWIFSKKKKLKEFIAKNDLEKIFFFKKSDFSFLWILVKNQAKTKLSFWALKSAFMGKKLANFFAKRPKKPAGSKKWRITDF